jgi:hypothetical protein
MVRRSLAQLEIEGWDIGLAELAAQHGLRGRGAERQARRQHECLLGRARCFEVLADRSRALVKELCNEQCSWPVDLTGRAGGRRGRAVGLLQISGGQRAAGAALRECRSCDRG